MSDKVLTITIYISYTSPLLNLTFNACLEVSGRDDAFPLIVSAHAYNYGWNYGFSKDQPILDRLSKVAKFYPDRINDFVTESCKINLLQSELAVPGAKLVFLYSQCRQDSMAFTHVKTIVNCLLEDTNGYSLPIPSWSENHSIPSQNVDFGFLSERRCGKNCALFL